MSAAVVMVTGAAGGIGRAIAERLTRDGYLSVIADVDETAARAVADTFQADAVRLDVTESASADAAVAAVIDRHGRLDALINCAGIHLQRRVTDMSDSDWDSIMSVNARGTFVMCRAAAREMMRAERGRIVNIVTRLGYGNPFSAAYMASKNAVWALTQCLAVELAAYGITVNAVAPGHVGPGTGMEAAFRAKAEQLGLGWDDFEAQVLRTVPAGRWCRPADVAGAVSYLLGDEASFVTGELINVTGGFTGYAAAPPKAEAAP